MVMTFSICCPSLWLPPSYNMLDSLKRVFAWPALRVLSAVVDPIFLQVWCLEPVLVLPWSELLCCPSGLLFLTIGRISKCQPLQWKPPWIMWSFHMLTSVVSISACGQLTIPADYLIVGGCTCWWFDLCSYHWAGFWGLFWPFGDIWQWLIFLYPHPDFHWPVGHQCICSYSLQHVCYIALW